MSDSTIVQSTQFVINELKIYTKNISVPSIDVRFIYEEINLFDSIFTPCLSGNIVIRDALGLSDMFLFDGSETIYIKISKDVESDEAIIEKTFRIYKQTNRTNTNMASEVYTLHFISEEFILSEQQKVSQAFTDQYSVAAYQILKNYLNVPSTDFGLIDNSFGIKKFIVPMLRPFDAIDWLARRSVDEQGSPNFIFFQNKLGFNFARLSSLYALPPIGTVNFNPKNITEDVVDELWGARYIKVLDQFDSIRNTRAGVYASKFVGFDAVTRSIGQLNINNVDTFQSMTHTNKTQNVGVFKNRQNKTNIEMHDSKVTYYPYSSNQGEVDYIKERDPVSIQHDDDTYRYILQRQAIVQNLLNQRVQIVLPGNFNVSSGFTVQLEMPTRSERETGQSAQDGLDSSINGKYIIIAAHHIIRQEKHEVIIEVATDSSNKDAVYEGIETQRI